MASSNHRRKLSLAAARQAVHTISEEVSQKLGVNETALGLTLSRADATLKAALAQADERTSQAETTAARRTSEAREAAIDHLRSTVESLKSSEDMLVKDLPGDPAEVRGEEDLCPARQVHPLLCLGSHSIDAAGTAHEFPAFAEFLNRNHLCVDGSSNSETVTDIIQNVVAQSYVGAPAGQAVVTVFNPRMNSTLSAFQRSVSTDAGIFNPVVPTREALEKTLQDHVGHLNAVQTSLGGQYRNLGDMVQATGQHEYPYRVLVLMDSPVDWSDRAFSDLERILAAGPRCGISVLLHFDSSTSAESMNRLTSMAAPYPTVRVNGSEAMLTSGDFSCGLLPARSLTTVQQIDLVDIVAKAAETGALPDVDFESLVQHTQRSSKDGIQVVVGKQGSQDVSFVMGDTISTLHNVLIGGAVGKGKSNLLKVLIYSLAASYSAEELEMYLLDFKEGVEFQQFIATETRRGLPNARLVSMESDQAFGISTLEHFNEEIGRRGQLFKQVGAKDISDYRSITGAVLPRWLLVADEFQVLFDEPDAQRAAELLESLSRKGRAFGLHIILASQTLSGIRFGGGKEAAIFGQFPVRIVLQQSAQESEVFLGSGNKAAAALRYRGQAVLNKMHGHLDANQIFVVAHAKGDYLDVLQNELAASGPSLPTRVYRGSEKTSTDVLLSSAVRPEARDEITMWLGETAAVASNVVSLSLGRRPLNNVLVLGSDFATAMSTLQTATISAARSATRPLRVNFLDTVPLDGQDSVSREFWDKALRDLGVETQWFGEDTLADFLAVYRRPASDADTLQVLLQPEASSFEYEADDADWADSIVRMPVKGVHTLGYWSANQMIPIRRRPASDYFAHQIFHSASKDIVADATRINPSRLPALPPSLAGLFSSPQSSTEIRVFRPVEGLTEADFKNWTQS